MVEWIISDGLTDYREAETLMEARANAIAAGEAEECIWLLEHPPLYTAGTSARREDLTDPDQNIRGGVAYLDWLMGEFDNDPVLVLAGYNAGEGAVARHDGVPPYDETRAYVPKVLAAWNVAKGLCKTPPVLISDGCVFAVPGNVGG